VTSISGVDGGLRKNKRLTPDIISSIISLKLIKEVIKMECDVVKNCKKHGALTESQIKREKNGLGYPSLRCNQCKIEKDQRYREKNRQELISKNMIYKKNNRDIVNEWNKKDRKENPEKYRRYEANYIAKHGKEKLIIMEITRRRGITIEQYKSMVLEQDNKCKICNKLETRKNRSREIGILSIDHCHDSNNVRCLLFHNCNTGIVKFFDDIELLKNAINYLESYENNG